MCTKKQEISREIKKLITEREEADRLIQSVSELLVILLGNLGTVSSIYHPLGFVQIKADQCDEYGSLKIHIWNCGNGIEQAPSWPIHQHKWDLRSFVFQGNIENSVYEVVEADFERANRLIYDVQFKDGKSVLGRTENYVHAVLASQYRFSQGEWYDVEISDFHASECTDKATCGTIVLTPPDTGRSPKVLGEKFGEEYYQYLRNAPSAQTLKNSIESILREMGQPK